MTTDREARKLKRLDAELQTETEKRGDTFTERLIRDWPAFRVGTKFLFFLYIAAALGLSGFHLYTSYFGLLEAWAHRAVHVLLVLLLAYLTPRKKKDDSSATRYYLSIFDVLPALLVVTLGIYILSDYMGIIVDRVGQPSQYDKIAVWVLNLLILEATRRRVGWPITILGVVFWLYTVWGHFVPGFLGHPRMSSNNITTFFFNTPMGTLGIPVAVSALYIILFIILAAFLFYANASDFFLKFAFALTGTVRGGPAKAAVVASGLFGSIHGSGPGNVMATGVFTIPLMKRLGYKPHFAGAVEAAASTGGIFLPPVMGATAFLIAEFTGTPYLRVCMHGLLPALCYYVVVFLMVHLEAIRLNLGTVDRSELPKLTEVLKEAYLMIPIVLIVVLLFMGYSVFRSASVAILAIIVLSFVRKSTRLKPIEFVAALEKGATNAVTIAVTCATASIVVGAATLTGLGTKLTNLIQMLSGGMLPIALFLTMIVAIILGMGMPATPVYVILVATAAPALLKMGVPILVSHMFIFYFGTMAALTPPVALSSYAAAAVAGANVNRLSFTAMKLAIAGFLIPYMFIYNHGLLLMKGFWNGMYSVATALPGFAAMAIGVSGYFLGEVSLWRRVVLVLGAVMLIWEGTVTDAIGFSLIGVAILTQYLVHRSKAAARQHTPAD